MTPQAAFEVLNRAAGLAPLGAPKFEGREAVLPTPFRAASAAAVSLAFGAQAAAEIWRFRGGERQTASIDFAAAAASLYARSLVRCNGEEIRNLDAGNAVTGFYQSADRHWLYLHGGSERLSERTLALLNAKADRAAVMEGVAKWNGRALEDAMAFMDLSGAMVRSEEEWKSSVAGRLAGAPIALKKIAAGPPGRPGQSALPLGGFRVLDLTHIVAGPAASQLLASYGAEVLSVGRDRSDCEMPFAAGKRRTVLDLSKPAEAEALRRLARDGDIFVDSFRPGALAAYGFSPASLAHIAPGTIYVSISAYGGEGPWAGRRGWEEVTQAATGIAAEQGVFMAARRGHRHEVQPELLPAAVLGSLTGYLAAAGALAAVLRRIREGGSWLVEVSLAATATWLSSLGRIDAAQLPAGFDPGTGLDQYWQSCETKDGRFEFLGPVVRLPLTPPLRGSLPEGFVSPVWASAHEEANAAEIQPA